MDNVKRKHGGFRPGAGRKAVENKRVQVTATVERDTRDTIKDYCNTKRTRLGRLLDTMVEQGFFDKDGFRIGDKVLVPGIKTECIVVKYDRERKRVCVRDRRGFGSCWDASQVKHFLPK